MRILYRPRIFGLSSSSTALIACLMILAGPWRTRALRSMSSVTRRSMPWKVLFSQLATLVLSDRLKGNYLDNRAMTGRNLRQGPAADQQRGFPDDDAFLLRTKRRTSP